jgi:triosephosphate isomerase
MRLIRELLENAFGREAASGVRVLYGGSVNAGNVASYAELPVCDGCLVGGASLKASEFVRMIEVVAEVCRRGSGASSSSGDSGTGG